MTLESLRPNINTLYYLAVFTLPFLILFFTLLSEDISFNSDTAILTNDGFHQYVIFAENLRNILRGSDSIFYTFTSGLGLNFYALVNCYLGSFFSPFVYFFSLKSIPNAIYIFTLLKVTCMGIGYFYSLKQLYPKVLRPFSIVLSTSYALMSFAISQVEINIWFDVFILLPLIILGINRLLGQQKFIFYYLSLTILFIQNYYFEYMVVIFLILYFLVQLTKEFKQKVIPRRFIDLTVVSTSTDLSSCIILLPTYLDLSTRGEEFSRFAEWFIDASWFLDLFAKNFVGSYDTTKFGSIPMIYVGTFPLVLATIFFMIKSIRWQTRLAYGIMLALIVASFCLELSDLIWQGMHSPNILLHRYSQTLFILIILLAAETSSHLKELTLKQYLIGIIPLALGLIVAALFQSHYDFLEPSQVTINFAFLAAYAIMLISCVNKYLSLKLSTSFTLILTIFEISLNTYYQIAALDSEQIFPSQQSYNRNLTDIDKLANETQELNTTFYHTGGLLPQTGNGNMKCNYNGISQFSSIRSATSNSTLDRLGFKSTGTNLNLRYQNNTLLVDSLFAVKYNLSRISVDKFGFSYVDGSGNVSLHEDQYANQLAILMNGIYKDIGFGVNTLDNQTSLINNLAGLSEKYFTRLASQLTSGANLFNNRVTTTNDGQLTTSATYQAAVTANAQLHVNVPDITFSNDSSESVQVTVNGETTEYMTGNAYSFFDLGCFEEGQTLDITFTLPESSQVSFNRPNFYALGLTSYQKAMAVIDNPDVTAATDKNTITAIYKIDEDSSLSFTISYGKGWTVTQNGKKLAVPRAQDDFVKIDVKAGEGKVTLTYIPNGFREGAYLSILGIILFLAYMIARRKHHLRIKAS